MGGMPYPKEGDDHCRVSGPRSTPHAPAHLCIRELLGRRLHEIGQRPDQRPNQHAVQRQLGTAHGVNDYARQIGHIPYYELELLIERHAAERSAFQADVCRLLLVSHGTAPQKHSRAPAAHRTAW